MFDSFYKLNKTLLVAVFLPKCNFAVNVWLFATGISCVCGCLLMEMAMKQPFLSTPTKSAAVALCLLAMANAIHLCYINRMGHVSVCRLHCNHKHKSNHLYAPLQKSGAINSEID